MKILLALVFLLAGCAGPGEFAAAHRCTGAVPCRACKNCKYCAHCSKVPHGTCGACVPIHLVEK